MKIDANEGDDTLKVNKQTENQMRERQDYNTIEKTGEGLSELKANTQVQFNVTVEH